MNKIIIKFILINKYFTLLSHYRFYPIMMPNENTSD